MRKLKLLIVLLIAVAFYSCKPSYDKQYNWAYPVAGDWKVEATYTAGGVVKSAGKFEMKSYNSSFGKDSIWFDDYPVYHASTKSWTYNFWEMKFKTAVNMSAKTFGTTGSINAIDGYPITIKVSNGKIIGNDSISMDVIFGDDPTTTYKIAGHRELSYEEYVQQ